MAVLTTEQRQQIKRGLARYWSRINETCVLNKAEMIAAVEATDTWINSNAASFNAALPIVTQDGLTAMQKTLLFCAVALRRVGVDMLKRVFGGVD